NPVLENLPIYRKPFLLLLLSACVAAGAAAQASDSLSVARRVVAATSLAAKEYAVGVPPGGRRVFAPAEVEEAKQFLDGARGDGGRRGAVRAVSWRDGAGRWAQGAAPGGPAARESRRPRGDEHRLAGGRVPQGHDRRGGHGDAAVRGDALARGPLGGGDLRGDAAGGRSA